MYVGRDFSPADAVESELYAFDFVNDLAEGEVIIGIVGDSWVCKVADDSEGADDNAADHTAIAALYEGSKTFQQVSGLVAGVKYVLQAVVETDQGNTHSLWSHVTCMEPK